MDIVTSEIIGIEIFNPVIFDPYGLFYSMKGLRQINLPIGEFQINGKFKQIPKINYSLPKLPLREKIYRVPKLSEMNIQFSKNPEEIAKINIHENLLVLNPGLRGCSSAEFWSVIFHEMGHYMYKTESKCDTYSVYRMLQEGFNPSQIKGFINILPDNIERKKNIFNLANFADKNR